MAIDPRRLRPSELCRLLNSTPLGEVINERQLHRHRTRAGLRVGDERHVDLLAYVAWLAWHRHKPRQAPAGDPYETLKEKARARNAAIALTPSHGRFVGASSQPYSDYKRRPGDRIGHNWRIPNVQGKRAVRHVLFDTNYWKSFVYTRLPGATGAICTKSAVAA